MSDVELADEVRAALRDLVEEIGAVSARIVEHDELRTGVPARTLALGGGEYLRVELPTRHHRESDVEAGIKFGYAANQIGFGWTNAAYLDLLAGLEPRARKPAASRTYPFAWSLADGTERAPLASR